ncbi:cation transporter [Dorea acetigenes]|uniref:Cation transporter n=1 Tax=Dorea acetigenes TaxID=2981787 RepID=A0ABT2RM29_9FIRM|nr:heavy metal-associated domain-containing protein [Dorea acetigenes]MCB6414643.1 cation transporter [Faecalimonas umbilicata]MCU6686450.1 cation transporter [Dorea acetigenes]SCI96305.1 putative mercuric reductase [uncultured Clostridium sp.]
MIKMILEVEGMSCGMCESHINDTVRKQFEVKKVVSSHKKGKTEIIAEAPLDETQLRKVIGDTGYEVKSVRVEPYTKKGLFW